MTTTALRINISPDTLAEVISRLQAMRTLSDTKRRDLVSAVNRAAALIGRPPEEIAASLPDLRQHLLMVHPARAGIAAKTLANIKADLRTALVLTRAASRRLPRAELSDGWQSFLRQADKPHQAWSLSRLASYCARKRIDPCDMSDEVMRAFELYLEGTLLTADPKKLCKAMAQTWNGIVSRRGLNIPTLAIPQANRYRAAPLSDYPLSLQTDIARYMDRLKHTNLFDTEGPLKPLKPMSLRNIEAHLRQFLAAAVSCGCKADQFRALADVIPPEIIKTAFRAIAERNGGQMPVGLQNMAGTLLAIARHYVKAPAGDLAAIEAIKKRTFQDLSGMSEKNKLRLSQFDDWRQVAALVSLPDLLISRAKSGPLSSRSALDAMTAVAIAILLACPMRVKNLAGLDIETNLRVMTGKGQHRLYAVRVEGARVKNGTAIDVDLGDHASGLLRSYLDIYRRLLSDKPGTALFPQRSGGARAPDNFGQHLQSVIYRATGLTVHPHLFRHLAGKLYLEQHPGDYETVRRLLGHKKLDTTLSFYAQFDNRLAQKRYEDVVLAASKRRVRK